MPCCRFSLSFLFLSLLWSQSQQRATQVIQKLVSWQGGMQLLGRLRDALGYFRCRLSSCLLPSQSKEEHSQLPLGGRESREDGGEATVASLPSNAELSRVCKPW